MLFILILFGGCDRNATFKNTITFKGAVCTGSKNSTTGVITAQGPAAAAQVACINTNESTATAADGTYTLVVNAVRTFQGTDTDTYQLSASNATGQDETVTVSAKPGDTVSVRTMVLYSHTEAQ